MNYYRFKRGKLKEFVCKAVSFSGSERKLKEKTKISLGNIYYYKKEKLNISQEKLDKILDLLNLKFMDIQQDIQKIFSSNWGQKKGARKAYELKLKNGTFEKNLKKMNKVSSKLKKEWHKKMKRDFPRKYYQLQYSYFKKVGGYKFKTQCGKKVRNLLEREIADYFDSKKIEYYYEPLVIANGNPYFPDFKIGNIIIEATMWKGNMKIEKLMKKYIDFTEEGYTFIVIVSDNVKKYYINRGFEVITNIQSIQILTKGFKR